MSENILDPLLQAQKATVANAKMLEDTAITFEIFAIAIIKLLPATEAAQLAQLLTAQLSPQTHDAARQHIAALAEIAQRRV